MTAVSRCHTPQTDRELGCHTGDIESTMRGREREREQDRPQTGCHTLEIDSVAGL